MILLVSSFKAAADVVAAMPAPKHHPCRGNLPAFCGRVSVSTQFTHGRNPAEYAPLQRQPPPQLESADPMRIHLPHRLVLVTTLAVAFVASLTPTLSQETTK